jgi:hypothetical protein
MSGCRFACGVRSMKFADPREKNSSPKPKVYLSKKHYARFIGSKIVAGCLDCPCHRSSDRRREFWAPSSRGSLPALACLCWPLSSGGYHNANLSLTRAFTPMPRQDSATTSVLLPPTATGEDVSQVVGACGQVAGAGECMVVGRADRDRRFVERLQGCRHFPEKNW